MRAWVSFGYNVGVFCCGWGGGTHELIPDVSAFIRYCSGRYSSGCCSQGTKVSSQATHGHRSSQAYSTGAVAVQELPNSHHFPSEASGLQKQARGPTGRAGRPPSNLYLVATVRGIFHGFVMPLPDFYTKKRRSSIMPPRLRCTFCLAILIWVPARR